MGHPPPPRDPDRRLAGLIGRIQRGDAPLEVRAREADDPLLDLLLAYRRQRSPAAPDPARSRRLWSRIEAEIAPGTGADRSAGGTGDAGGAGEAPPARRDRTPRRPDSSPGRRSAPRRQERLWGRLRGGLGWAAGVAAALMAGALLWLLLPPQDPVRVARAGEAPATYASAAGDTVRLRPHSALYRLPAAESGSEAARYRLEGEAFFAVADRADGSFAVEAGSAVVRVLGTRFAVQTWTPEPRVFVEEGRVEMRAARGGEPGAVLGAGQAGVLGADGSVATKAGDGSAFTDWLRGRVVFDSEPAGAVAAELEQHFGIRVRLPDSLARERVTGRLLLDAPSETLRDFGLLLGGRFDEDGGRFRFRPE
jgi:transmembrane sensor